MSLFIHFTFDIKEDECICSASVSIQLAKQHGTFSVTKVGEASALRRYLLLLTAPPWCHQCCAIETNINKCSLSLFSPILSQSARLVTGSYLVWPFIPLLVGGYLPFIIIFHLLLELEKIVFFQAFSCYNEVSSACCFNRSCIFLS